MSPNHFKHLLMRLLYIQPDSLHGTRTNPITKDAIGRPGLHSVWPGATGQAGDLRVLWDHLQQDHAMTI